MIKVAINGYGRIGRCVLRALFEAQQQGRFGNIELVAINELADCSTIAHLTQYDSTHGRLAASVSAEHDQLIINDQRIAVLHQADITALPWAALKVDLVLECTGAFNDRATAEQHIQAGAGHVLFSQPATAEVDATVVYGVNHQQLTGRETIVSNASCTTNCIVPVIHTLNATFGIDSGVITTIHSAMNDQPVIDAYHHTDLRKTRSAIQSMIPVDTGLAKGIDRLLPELAGRFEAQAMRVPTVNVSAMDLSLLLQAEVSTEQINHALKAAAQQQYNGVLGYTEELLASCDFNHDPRSGIVDATQTRVAGGRMVKVLTWFDNEWAYANRMLDTADYWSQKF